MIVNLSMSRGVKSSADPKAIDMITNVGALRFQMEQWRLPNVIAEDDWVVVEFTNSGTNTGPLRTAIGDFPPTNRKIEVPYCSVMQIKNGKVISGRDYYDVNTILSQLELLSE